MCLCDTSSRLTCGCGVLSRNKHLQRYYQAAVGLKDNHKLTVTTKLLPAGGYAQPMATGATNVS